VRLELFGLGGGGTATEQMGDRESRLAIRCATEVREFLLLQNEKITVSSKLAIRTHSRGPQRQKHR
jgi:hypothetical protein